VPGHAPWPVTKPILVPRTGVAAPLQPPHTSGAAADLDPEVPLRLGLAPWSASCLAISPRPSNAATEPDHLLAHGLPDPPLSTAAYRAETSA